MATSALGKKKKDYYGGAKKGPGATIGIDGFYRINIVDPDGRVAGDSGWNHNVISNLGLANYIAYKFCSTGGSIASIGLLHTTNATSAMCAGSFASSTLGNAQAINCTYDIVFSATATT
jgi:hypothetical protein